MKIEDVKPGMKIRHEWAPKTPSRPAKFVTIDVENARFDSRDMTQDYWKVTGTATPEWGNGQYEPFAFARLVPAKVEVEIV